MIKGLHTIFTMSVSRYGIIDQTNNLALLRKWWNPLPVTYFDTELFFAEFRKAFQSKGDNSLIKEAYQIINYNNIISLDQMLKMLSLLMRNTNDRSLFSILLDRKPNEYRGNFDVYVEKIENLTGIKVKDGNDLKRLQDEITRLFDKYQNNAKQPPGKKEKMSFFEEAMIIFSVMEMTYSGNLKLSELAALKIRGDKRIEQLNKTNEKTNKH